MIQVQAIQHCCTDLENEPFDIYEGTIQLNGKAIGSFFAKLWHYDYIGDFIYIADNESEDSGLIASSLKRILNGWCGKVLVIETINLDPEYRGKGYAKEAMKQFTRQFDYAIKALKAFPLQWKDKVNEETRKEFTKDLNKLKRVYKSWGFKPSQHDVMYMHHSIV